MGPSNIKSVDPVKSINKLYACMYTIILMFKQEESVILFQYSLTLLHYFLIYSISITHSLLTLHHYSYHSLSSITHSLFLSTITHSLSTITHSLSSFILLPIKALISRLLFTVGNLNMSFHFLLLPLSPTRTVHHNHNPIIINKVIINRTVSSLKEYTPLIKRMSP